MPKVFLSLIGPKWLSRICLLLPILLFFNQSYAQQVLWVVPKAEQMVKNPVKSNPGTLAAARKIYMTNCAPCHGKDGKGDGPASAALKIKPADHTSAAVQRQTDGSLYWMISTGHAPMPVYKKILTDQQRWELVDYIRTLAKKRG
ncbi:MAG TPA: cytochrome c [Chitinophagaceae bacterium]|nr:cytochrome c [Chitinophagaceae bacterium]